METVNARDEEFRQEALNGKMLPLIMKVCFPLAIFQAFSQLFQMIDTLMASHISSTAVSTVVYLVQLNHIIAAIGSALAIGGSILVAHAYGAGNYDGVKKAISTVIAIASIAAIVVLAIVPFSSALLRATGTPEAFINEGSLYFSISIISLVIAYFNTIYISIEKTRGKSRKILILNLISVMLKLLLTALFVYLMNGTIIHIAIATLISNLSIFIVAIFGLSRRNEAFAFSMKYVSFKKESIMPILRLSFPAMVEKMAFSFGKATVNKMAAGYGTDAVGAAGISNNMSGMLTGLQVGYEDGGSALVGQAYGAKDLDRTVRIYRRIQLVEVVIGISGFFIFSLLSPAIARLFAMARGGYNESFYSMIVRIYRYELLGTLILSFNYAATSLLLGCGKTRLTLLVNFARVFVFRIPVIWMLKSFSSLDYQAIGIAMAVSNTLTGIFGAIVAETVIASEKRKRGKNQANA